MKPPPEATSGRHLGDLHSGLARCAKGAGSSDVPNNLCRHFCMPHLFDIEVAQVIRRYAANGDIDRERGRIALIDLADLPLRRYPLAAYLGSAK